MKGNTAYGVICCILLALMSFALMSFALVPSAAWSDPAGPGRVLPGSNRPQLNTQKAPGPYTIAMTTRYIEEEMEKDNAVGLSIALVNEDGVVWEKGFGWADKANQIPAAPESVYMIGSASKFLTALATLRLEEQGLVNLDSPVVNYLPRFAIRNRYGSTSDQITVRRLLNHHSGLPGDIYTGSFLLGSAWDERYPSLYMDWLFDYLEDAYPSLPPGTMEVYCNTGFILAGELALEVDGAAGETYPEYMDRVLFSPLGMTHSSYHTIYENLALGHVSGEAVTPMQSNGPFGATGGVYSTVRDMAKVITMVITRARGLTDRPICSPEPFLCWVRQKDHAWISIHIVSTDWDLTPSATRSWPMPDGPGPKTAARRTTMRTWKSCRT